MVAGAALAVVLTGNLWFSSHRDIACRALDPLSPVCREDGTEGWDILARTGGAGTKAGKVGNDEWTAIDLFGPAARTRLAYAIQRHAIPGYKAPSPPINFPGAP